MMNNSASKSASEKLAGFSIIAFFAASDLIVILGSFGVNLGALAPLISAVRYGSVILVAISFKNRIPASIVYIILGFVFAVCFSCLLSIEIQKYISPIILGFLKSTLPMMVLVSSIQNAKFFMKYMKIASYIEMIKVIVIPLFAVDRISAMGLAYTTLVYWAVICWYAMKDKGAVDIILTVFCGVLYIIFSTRGALVCMIAFVIINKLSCGVGKQNLRFCAILAVATALIYFVWSKYGEVLYVYLWNQGVKSRVLAKILNGTFLQDSNRTLIYKQVIEAIGINPFGYGIGYDRVLFGSSDSYSHNMFLELFLSIGILPGTLVAIWIIYCSASMLFRKNNEYSQGLFMVFGVTGLIIYQTSLSIWQYYHIFVAMSIYLLNKAHVNEALQGESV